MTAAEKATELISQWLDETRGLPMILQLAKLGLKVAEAIDSAEQAAYERGIRAAVEFQDQEISEQIQALAHIAGLAGAQGLWIIRGAEAPDLIFNQSKGELATVLNLEDAPLIFVARFPDDGGKPGIEFHAGGDEAN
jgi:hypothetical protein